MRNAQRFFPDTQDSLEDFRLLNHNITRPNDNPDPAAAKYIRDPLHDQALLLSFAYPCILHLIQEFSALELAHQEPWKRDSYHVLAGRHSTQGLEGATALLRHLNESDYHAAYTAATLACINFFARGPRFGEYLLFNWDGPSQWLPLLHGIRTIIDLVGIEKIVAGPAGRAPPRIEMATEPAKVMLKCTDLDWAGQFQRLHALVASSPDFAADVDSLGKLERCFEATYGRDGVFKGSADMQNAFIWPYQLGEDFTARMQARQPLSLIIVADFALLLKYFEFIWYMVGWCDHVLMGVARVIEERYRSWLDWPFEKACKIRVGKGKVDSGTMVNVAATPEQSMPL